MAVKKNKGPKLYFSQFGGEQPIPPEFIAAMERAEEVQAVPDDVTPEALSDTIVESSVKTDRTDERVRRTVKKKAGNITLSAIRTNDQGQPVQVVRTLYPTGTTPTVSTATKKVAVQDLGNGWSIEEVATEGSYVGGVFTEGVFTNNLYQREVPNPYPEEFRASLADVTTRADSAGTAVDPTLSGNELRETQEQISDGKKRITITSKANLGSPITHDKHRETNQFKQDVTVTRKLTDTGDTTPTATALKDVAQTQISDGLKIVETKEVASVFDGDTRSIEKPDVTPVWAKSLLTTLETSSEAAATSVSDPTLTTGQFRKTVQRTTEKTVKTDVTARSFASLPITRTNTKLTREFGGGIVDEVETFAVGVQTINGGELTVVDASVEDLGNGTSIKRTDTLEDEWPTLYDYDIDPETGQTVLTSYRVIDPGAAATATSSSGVITRYKHIDKWRTMEIIENYSDPADYDEQRFGAHNFPALVDITTWSYSDGCGTVVEEFRGAFSAMVEMKTTISYTTTKQTISGLTLIPKSFILGRYVQLPGDMLVDGDTLFFSGTCFGSITYTGSDPDYSTYVGSIQGTEQLITGESVRTKSGLYRNTKVYVTML